MHLQVFLDFPALYCPEKAANHPYTTAEAQATSPVAPRRLGRAGLVPPSLGGLRAVGTSTGLAWFWQRPRAVLLLPQRPQACLLHQGPSSPPGTSDLAFSI